MFICEECGKDCRSKTSYYRHRRNDHPDFSKLIWAVHSRTPMRLCAFNEYVKNLALCPVCSKEYHRGEKSQKFCGRSCAQTASNAKRGPVTQEGRNQRSEAMTAFYDRVGRKGRTQHDLTCVVCNTQFRTIDKTLKTCSASCRHTLSSINGVKRAEAVGTNFSVAVGDFQYKGISVRCDSLLEAAAVVHLVDAYKVERIERMTSILHFLDHDGKDRRFLPDFLVTMATGCMVVEVKSVYKSVLVINDYNKHFCEKRLALEDFCSSRGFTPLWLDVNHSAAFKKLYRRVCEHRSEYGILTNGPG